MKHTILIILTCTSISSYASNSSKFPGALTNAKSRANHCLGLAYFYHSPFVKLKANVPKQDMHAMDPNTFEPCSEKEPGAVPNTAGAHGDLSHIKEEHNQKALQYIDMALTECTAYDQEREKFMRSLQESQSPLSLETKCTLKLLEAGAYFRKQLETTKQSFIEEFATETRKQ